MRYIQVLTLLACTQITIANPISLEARAKGMTNSASKSSQSFQGSISGNSKDVTKDSVSRAADNFAQDAGIVSNAINKMTSMTDQAAIKATAQRAFDAESDEDNQRKILAAAAGSAGDSSNGLIMKFTPTVLDGLSAITKDASPESVQKNTEMMEGPRNEKILPSITQLSNAALDSMSLSQSAPELKLTTGASANGNNKSKNSNNGDNGDNNSNNNGDGNSKADGNSNSNNKIGNNNNNND